MKKLLINKKDITRVSEKIILDGFYMKPLIVNIAEYDRLSKLREQLQKLKKK